MTVLSNDLLRWVVIEMSRDTIAGVPWSLRPMVRLKGRLPLVDFLIGTMRNTTAERDLVTTPIDLFLQ